GVHLVAGRGLGRAAVPAPVVRDDAIASLQEEQHLIVPVIGRERPAMMEHDGLPAAPVLIEDLCSVLDSNRAHNLSPVLQSLLQWFVDCSQSTSPSWPGLVRPSTACSLVRC